MIHSRLAVVGSHNEDWMLRGYDTIMTSLCFSPSDLVPVEEKESVWCARHCINLLLLLLLLVWYYCTTALHVLVKLYMMMSTITEQPWPKSKHANDGLSKYGPPTLNPRDLMGYGGNTPHFKWPNKGHAKVALNFCIHYEAGGMYDIYIFFVWRSIWMLLHTTTIRLLWCHQWCCLPILYSFCHLSHATFCDFAFWYVYYYVGEECELHGENEHYGKRHVAWETICDYGARAGFWRLHRLFTRRKLPVTVFAVGMALERNPMVALALREEQNKKDYKWEVASAGYRSVEYSSSNKMDEAFSLLY